MTDEQKPAAELTRGEKMKRTRAANAKKKAEEAAARASDNRLRATEVFSLIDAGNNILASATADGVTIQNLSFTRDGVTVTADGEDWILS